MNREAMVKKPPKTATLGVETINCITYGSCCQSKWLKHYVLAIFLFVKKLIKISISNTFLTQILLNGVRIFYFVGDLRVKSSVAVWEYNPHPTTLSCLFFVPLAKLNQRFL